MNQNEYIKKSAGVSLIFPSLEDVKSITMYTNPDLRLLAVLLWSTYSTSLRSTNGDSNYLPVDIRG